MRLNNKTFILYFYLLIKKIRNIENRSDNTDSKEKKKLHSYIKLILEKIGIAALTTIIVFMVIVYMNTGHLYIFSIPALIEMGFAFIFLFLLLLAHQKISKEFNKRHNSLIKAVMEMLSIIFITVLIYTVTNIIPLLFIYGREVFLPTRVRTAYISSVIISLFFYYFVEREKSKKKLQAEMLNSARLQKESFQAQLEGLKNQVNPHFLFNSLNVLGSLIHKDQDQAVEFTRRLSDLYRSFLDNSNEPLILLEKELEIVNSYIYLLKVRFGKSVEFRFNIEPESKKKYLPPGSLQMLIENAIKHNGSTSKKPLIIQVSSNKDVLEVKNQLQPRRENLSSTKTGLKNIESRYHFLTDKLPEFTKTEIEFIAKLPLLKVEDYEHSNH